MRYNFDLYMLKLCENLALRSTCIRRQTGAIIVNSRNEIIGTGFNGAPRGIQHCTKETCLRMHVAPGELPNDMCMAVHAELNALLQMTRRDFPPFTMYTKCSPCFVCLKAAINAGITKIVYMDDYPHPQWFRELYSRLKGIKMIRLSSKGVDDA